MKTLNDLPEEWQDTALKMYKKGAADVEIKAELGLTHAAWKALLIDSDVFNATISLGRQFSEAYWYREGRMNLDNPKFQQALWYRNMQNRFGWRDKSDSTSSDQAEEEDSLESIEDVKRAILDAAGTKH